MDQAKSTVAEFDHAFVSSAGVENKTTAANVPRACAANDCSSPRLARVQGHCGCADITS
jgi:hypothetical protein